MEGSRDEERERRIKKISGDVKSGDELQRITLAQNEISGIQSELQNNLEMEKVAAESRLNNNNTLRQAAEIGATTAGIGMVSQPTIQQQVETFNPYTQQLLQQYGIKPGPPQNSISRNQSVSNTKSVSKSGEITNIKTENVTNNTTNSKTEVKIVQPQIPMRAPVQQVQQAGNGGDTQARFKTWLSNAFAKQQNDYEIQKKEFRKREWSLSRSANKMMRKIESVSKSFADRMDPRNMGTTIMGQLKYLLLLFGGYAIAKWWTPLMKRIASFEYGFRAVFGLPINGDLEKSTGGEGHFINQLKKFIGIDIDTEEGRHESLLGGIGTIFREYIGRLIKRIDLFMKDREIAIKSVKFPTFDTPKISIPGLSGLMDGITGGLKNIAQYLGDIITAALGGSAGMVKNAAKNVSRSAQEISKNGQSRGIKDYYIGDDNFLNNKKREYMRNSDYNVLGNLKNEASSTLAMSGTISSMINNKSGTVYTGSVASGLSKLSDAANNYGIAVIDKDLLYNLGLNNSDISVMSANGQIRPMRYKLIKTNPSVDKIRNDLNYNKGFGEKVGESLSGKPLADIIGNSVEYVGGKAGGVANLAGKILGGSVKAAGNITSIPGRFVGSTIDDIGLSMKYRNSGYKLVPIDSKEQSYDGSPAIPVNEEYYGITKEGFNYLKSKLGLGKDDALSLENKKFVEYIDKRLRQKKVASGITGPLSTDIDLGNLNAAHSRLAAYNSEINKLYDPNNPEFKHVNQFEQNLSNTVSSIGYKAKNMIGDTSREIAYRIDKSEKRDNVMKVMNRLMAEGLTKEQAAGVVGNLLEESGLRFWAHNKEGGGQGAQGIAQWRGSRIDEFRKRYGKEVTDSSLEEQTDYLIWELNNKFKKVFDKIKNSSGTKEAAEIMLKEFEKPGNVGEAVVNRRTNSSISALNLYNEEIGGGYEFFRRPADTWDIPSAIITLNKNVYRDYSDGGNGRSKSPTKSIGYCARYVRLALEAGGISVNKDRPKSAYEYAYWLYKYGGFSTLDKAGYKELHGDIVVFNRMNGHPDGHIAMWNGDNWVSDFIQNSIYASKDYQHPDNEKGFFSQAANTIATGLNSFANWIDPNTDSTLSKTLESDILKIAQEKNQNKFFESMGAKIDETGTYIDNGRTRVYLNTSVRGEKLTNEGIESVVSINEDGIINKDGLSESERQKAINLAKDKYNSLQELLKPEDKGTSNDVFKVNGKPKFFNLGRFYDVDSFANNTNEAVINYLKKKGIPFSILLTSDKNQIAQINTEPLPGNLVFFSDVEKNKIVKSGHILYKRSLLHYPSLGINSNIGLEFKAAGIKWLTPQANRYAKKIIDLLSGKLDLNESMSNDSIAYNAKRILKESGLIGSNDDGTLKILSGVNPEDQKKFSKENFIKATGVDNLAKIQELYKKDSKDFGQIGDIIYQKSSGIPIGKMINGKLQYLTEKETTEIISGNNSYLSALQSHAYENELGKELLPQGIINEHSINRILGESFTNLNNIDNSKLKEFADRSNLRKKLIKSIDGYKYEFLLNSTGDRIEKIRPIMKKKGIYYYMVDSNGNVDQTKGYRKKEEWMSIEDFKNKNKTGKDISDKLQQGLDSLISTGSSNGLITGSSTESSLLNNYRDIRRKFYGIGLVENEEQIQKAINSTISNYENKIEGGYILNGNTLMTPQGVIVGSVDSKGKVTKANSETIWNSFDSIFSSNRDLVVKNFGAKMENGEYYIPGENGEKIILDLSKPFDPNMTSMIKRVEKPISIGNNLSGVISPNNPEYSSIVQDAKKSTDITVRNNTIQDLANENMSKGMTESEALSQAIKDQAEKEMEQHNESVSFQETTAAASLDTLKTVGNIAEYFGATPVIEISKKSLGARKLGFAPAIEVQKDDFKTYMEGMKNLSENKVGGTVVINDNSNNNSNNTTVTGITPSGKDPKKQYVAKGNFWSNTDEVAKRES